jgi:LPS-assembly lipoprotein
MWCFDMNRREWTKGLLGLSTIVSLSACGFKLRGSYDYAFNSLFVEVNDASLVGKALIGALNLEGKVKVLTDPHDRPLAQAVLELDVEQREKTVTAINAAGQVREMQLRLRMNYRLKEADGKGLITEGQVVQHRDISYNETAALGKETEEIALYKDLQGDLVQQLLRRLSAVRSLVAPT